MTLWVLRFIVQRRVLAIAAFQRIGQIHQLVGGIGSGEGARRSGCDIAQIAPAPGSLRDIGVGEKTLGPVGAVAGDKGLAFLLGKNLLHLIGQPLLEIDRGIIEQALGCRRHGIKFHGRKLQFGQCGRGGLGACGGFTHPAARRTGNGEGLLVEA